ncbi:unnamed protein product [Brugia pahangi]|uniref:Col_cuticle_N domain-containing protein n=1 Tax=Brugia pahangi TaxID=6280 RepID=A0A0N4TYI2_BRUPA|nr:unnamed protein product [Brugia pahangi]
MMFGKASPPEHQLRQSAFLAVIISTVAVITSIITLPMLYSFIIIFQSHLFREIEYCKARTKDINIEFSLLSNKASDTSNDRMKRQHSNYGINSNEPSIFDQYPQLPLNTNHKLSSRSFCSCQQGSVGQSGAPGDNGPPGVDGMPGTDGNNGRDAKILVVLEKESGCFVCPQGPRGVLGMPGFKGLKGAKGSLGKNGTDGEDGRIGLQGARGPAGDMGKIGPKGVYGKPGSLIKVGTSQGRGFKGRNGPSGGYGPRGKPGCNGKSSDGPIGPRGTPGLEGKPGTSGTIGPPGARGRMGENGNCRQCSKLQLLPGHWKIMKTFRFPLTHRQ